MFYMGKVVGWGTFFFNMQDKTTPFTYVFFQVTIVTYLIVSYNRYLKLKNRPFMYIMAISPMLIVM